MTKTLKQLLAENTVRSVQVDDFGWVIQFKKEPREIIQEWLMQKHQEKLAEATFGEITSSQKFSNVSFIDELLEELNQS